MKYINTFKNHASYEEKLNGGVDISLPNVSYCEDIKDVHYNPYNTVEFYVGEITPPQTVKIYTDSSTSVDVTVSEGNKWYSCVLPKDKGLFRISGNTVNKVVVKADIITTSGETIIPYSTVEAFFKGSNTSMVTDMSYMFNRCSGLTSLDLSGFNTSNVTDMDSMFYMCSSLTSLDLSDFNTSNVTRMNKMFSYCSGLTSLGLSGLDTSKVTDMSYMFDRCSGLTSLDLSGFNTSNVTNMSCMFDRCSGLTSLDLSNFVTSNVTDMDYMFKGCSGLTSLDLSGWNMSNVTSMYNMFNGCSKLKTIRMKDCSEATINKIKEQLTEDNITRVTFVTE